MFSKKNRISSEEIQKIFSSEKKNIHSEFFLLKREENPLSHPRFAILVPKKVGKTSVARHRNKRLVVSLIENAGIKTRNDYVLTLKKDLCGVDSALILADLVKILI